VDISRGYGVRLQFYYQSLGQLKKCFPDGQDQTLLANVAQVYFGVNDWLTAEYVSNRCGEATIVIASGGTSTGTSQQYSGKGESSYSTSSNKSDNWGQHGRKLLKPEEVLALPHRIAITFTPGVPPIWTTLVRYFEEANLGQEPERPGFRERFKATAKVVAESLALLAAALFLASAFFVNSQGRVATRQPPVNYQQRFQNP